MTDGQFEVRVNDENFRSEILEETLPVLVDFWAEWCGPCLMIAPLVEELAREYKDKLKVCKVNVDEAPRHATRYGIMSIPTLAIFKNGEIMDKVVGVVPRGHLVSTIEAYV